MIDLLKQLCRQNGVSGDEDAIRAFIREQAAPYADSIRTDALGNLIVCKKGRRSDGAKLLLCAHMDEVGLIVTGSPTRASASLTLWAGWTAGWPSASRWCWARKISPASSA